MGCILILAEYLNKLEFGKLQDTNTQKLFFMTRNFFTKPVYIFAFIVIGSCTVNAQGNDSLIQKRIQQQQYVFVPQQFSSPSFTTSVMSPDYKIEVFTDSVVTNLPYFGRSNSAQYGRTDNDALVFVSTDFEYEAVPKKKGKWEITIKPKDAKGVRIFLTVFNNGDAQMDVTSPRKESMTFKGYVW